ncbi:MAG: VWA domain-containing protein, partial [Bradymonadaceae bacterium]
MMHFARPENLYFLFLLIPIAGLWAWYAYWKRRARARAGDAHLIEAMSALSSPRRALAQSICVFTATALLILAVAQPQWGRTDREVSRMGLDIVFALDLSRSMLASDVAPNRLQAARDELRTIMSRLDGDRVGLVVFTSISFAQSPLTTDYSAINFFLERLHPDQIPVGGTSIGAAMRDSIEVLLGRPLSANGQDASEMQRAKNQVVVLITDGEDHESDPLAAAQLARDHGIKVVSVGIGSPQGAQVPTYDERGNFSGYLRGRDGEYVVTRL